MKFRSVPVSFFFTPMHRPTGQHMEMFSKIYKYEVDLHPYIASKRSSFTIYAITESLETAQQMIRLEYPSLLMYSVSALSRCTLVDEKYSSDITIFDMCVRANYELCSSIKVLVVTRTLEEAVKICMNRYRLEILDIEAYPLEGNVITGRRNNNNSIMRVG